MMKSGVFVEGVTWTWILEHTHFDIGFSVNSIPREKEWLNGKVKRPIT